MGYDNETIYEGYDNETSRWGKLAEEGPKCIQRPLDFFAPRKFSIAPSNENDKGSIHGLKHYFLNVWAMFTH